MFISMIAAVIAMLVIMSYMSTSSIVVDASKVKVAFEKTKSVYSVEKIIVDGVEHLCQYNFQLCKDNEVGGIITLSFADLAGYIPDNFTNDNLYNSPFAIKILDNYTTVRLTHNMSDSTVQNVYIKHYQGKYYGISPKCSVPDGDACATPEVYHDYATSLKTRAALEI